MSRDPKRLLGGYATDTLSEEERRELLLAALDDQELFDDLVEEEGLRELLESPGARQELLAALAAPTGWERVRSWFARPATFGDLAAVAAALVLALGGYQVLLVEPPEETYPAPAAAQPPPATLSPAILEQLLALPPAQAVPARLEVETAVPGQPLEVRPGEAFVVRAIAEGPGRLLLLAELEDGSAVQVYPPAGRAPELLEAPAAGGPAVRSVTLFATGGPGPRRVRLVVAPVEIDFGASAPADIETLASRLTLVDLTYEVMP